MLTKPFLILLTILVMGCSNGQTETIPHFYKNQIATNFFFPVGKPHAKGYYYAQAFGKNQDLGDDWNTVTGRNNDLGDPIYT